MQTAARLSEPILGLAACGVIAAMAGLPGIPAVRGIAVGGMSRGCAGRFAEHCGNARGRGDGWEQSAEKRAPGDPDLIGGFAVVPVFG